MLLSIVMPPFVGEVNIDVRAKDNKGNNRYTVQNARVIQLLLRIWSDDSKTSLKKSRVIVKKYYRRGAADFIEEVVDDFVDSECVFEDFSVFPCRYEIVITEPGCRIEGVIRYV